MADWWASYIAQRAPKYGIDPHAALAVARMEGLSGGVGDQGTSFGPFQLHIGGANPHKDPRKARSFAESRKGIDYALRKMSESGAKGLKGPAAIESIVRNFERPANPGREIAGAVSHYGSTKLPKLMMVPPPLVLGSTGLGPPSTTVPQRGPMRTQIMGGGVDATLLANTLLSGVSPLKALSDAQIPFSFVDRRLPPPPMPKGAKQPPGMVDQQPPVATVGSSRDFKPGGGWGGSKRMAQGFRDLASKFGLDVMSEKRDTKATASGGVSDHWTGSKNAYAFDLSNGSNPTPEMDTAAREMMARLGVPYDGKGELVRNVNVGGYRVQVLYRTNVGGNHFNHIHVGVRKL